jgi:serine protease AprX
MHMMKPRRGIRWVVGVLAALAFVGASAPARAQSAAPERKLDAVVRAAVRQGQSVPAIVRFTDEAALARGADTVVQHGGRVRRAHRAIGALNVVIDAATAEALALDAGVAGVSVDAEVRAGAVTSPASAKTSGAGKARQRYNRSGFGVTVAIVDSGVRPHEDLPASRIRRFVDFVNGRAEPYDDFGHGTHVAGIVGGAGSVYGGVAPGVDVVALKVLDSTGAGRTSDVIAALEWVAANHATYNIRVVNLSLGHPVYEPASTDPLVQAAEALVRLGIVVVASAGNMGIDPRDQQVGYGGITSPANGPSVVAVGAVDTEDTESRHDDRVTDYSSRGPTRFDLLVKPDLVAAGHRVVSLAAPGSTLFDSYPALRVSAGTESVASYMTLSGTSMAAPVVAGVAALMVDANPRLSAGTVRALLEFTAQHLPRTNLMTQGAGYVNAVGAVRLASLIKPRVELGAIWLRSHNGVPVAHDELSGEQVPWGKKVIWGERVLLGDSAYVHLAAWDDNIVWGQEDDIIWGQDDIIWGQDDIIWGQCEGAGCDDIIWGQDEDIIWGQDTLDDIIWGQCDSLECEDIIWGQDDDIIWGQDDIIWGQDDIIWGQASLVWDADGRLRTYWADNTLWGFWSDVTNPASVTRQDADDIIWGQDDDIIWGQDDIIWGQSLGVLTQGGR